MTDLQIEASRRNGALSRGPVTLEGRIRASRNALKHGVYSQAVMVHGESPELFEEVRSGFHARFAPQGQYEEFLVNQLVACAWRMTRMADMEAALIDDRMALRAYAGDQPHDAATNIGLAFKELHNAARVVTACRQSESSLALQYGRALRTLEAAQAERKEKNETNLGPAAGPPATATRE